MGRYRRSRTNAKGRYKQAIDAIARALQGQEVRERLLTMKAEPVGNTPEQMRAMIQRDTDRWAPVISAAKISID
jgi:tripartite-type tricarboxylate transporter receptor subunit TctC